LKPVLIFPISDPHIGSTVGLHPNYVDRDGEWKTVDECGGWFYKNNPHYYLNSKQVKIWKHTENSIKMASALRQKIDADLLLINMGDIIDGDHHQTHQLTTKDEGQQAKTAREFMRWTKEQFDFQHGRDKLFIIEGTESHTRDNEETIAQDLNAEKFSDGASCAPFLELDIQGKLFWFYHHGVSAGYSYTSGNGLYNYIKKIYIDRRMQEKRPPNFIMTGHTHKYDYQTYRHDGHEIHGMILPPLQEKTRFTNSLPTAIVHETKLGFAPVVVDNGKINVLEPYLFNMGLGEKLVW
jgi:hypothetical protein